MRDLYKRLDLRPTADQSEIREKLRALEGPLKRDATFVLLDDKRRAIYDRTRRPLVEIGEIRALMGTDIDMAHWGSKYSDFDPARGTHSSRSGAAHHEQSKYASGDRPRTPDNESPDSQFLGPILILAGAILFWLLFL